MVKSSQRLLKKGKVTTIRDEFTIQQGLNQMRRCVRRWRRFESETGSMRAALERRVGFDFDSLRTKKDARKLISRKYLSE